MNFLKNILELKVYSHALYKTRKIASIKFLFEVYRSHRNVWTLDAMNIKSERLKKLETELEDLEQWMHLGLVPKKDVEKHREEIRSLRIKINEEKERLRFMKESGDGEEYAIPKRSPARQAYSEPHTLPGMDLGENMTDAGLDMETEAYEMETLSEEETEGGGGAEEDATAVEEEEDEDPFYDRNRWKRGILEDPDADNW